MRENSSPSVCASVRTSIVLPRPGTPSSRACDPASRHVSTPSTTARCPTMTLPISSRIVPSFFWNSTISSRAWSNSLMTLPRVARRRLLAGPYQLKIAAHVETIAGGNLVLVDHLFGNRLVLGEDVLVALADEAALRGAVNDLGA